MPPTRRDAMPPLMVFLFALIIAGLLAPLPNDDDDWENGADAYSFTP